MKINKSINVKVPIRVHEMIQFLFFELFAIKFIRRTFVQHIPAVDEQQRDKELTMECYVNHTKQSCKQINADFDDFAHKQNDIKCAFTRC